MAEVIRGDPERIYQVLFNMGAQHPETYFPTRFIGENLNPDPMGQIVPLKEVKDCLEQLTARGRTLRIWIRERRDGEQHPTSSEAYRAAE